MPVNGINTTSEHLVIRKGEQVGVGTKLAACTVALLDADQAHGECKDGTVIKGMRTTTEHDEGDWRRGLTWKQVVQGTRTPERDAQFRQWRHEQEANIKIGEEGANATTAEIKEILRLLWAYREIIADNPKRPKIIPGVYHQIVLNKTREQIRP